jgi:tetratricopeptide (TPR) repeat protein
MSEGCAKHKNVFSDNHWNANELIKQGDQFVFEYKYPNALDKFNSAIQLVPDCLDAWFKKSMVLNQMGEFKQASDAIEQVIRIDPKYYPALSFKSVIQSNVRNKITVRRNVEISVKQNSNTLSEEIPATIPAHISVEDLRIAHPKACEGWTKTDDDTLKQLFYQGKTIPELSALLERTENAINTRLKKISGNEKNLDTFKIFDDSQQKIIRKKPEARIQVDAAPGTGKTMVACSRIAWLIDHENIEPHNIWVISFTRTAVQEIRNRIQDFLTDKYDIAGINIATIDKFAWSIHSGATEKKKLKGSYDENIAGLIRLIGNHEGIAKELASAQHLIIDEAQDIVQLRADLLIKIISILPRNCGITVFSDQAQAIYGFTQKGSWIDPELSLNKKTLVERINKNTKGYGFENIEYHLNTVHRTNSQNLINLFTEIRKKVIKGKLPKSIDKDELDGIINLIVDCADESHPKILNGQQSASFKEHLLLFYGRSDVLQTSYLNKAKPHRIRMGHLPKYIKPWVGACFSEYTKLKLTKNDFKNLWKQNVERNIPADTDIETAWKLIYRYAGDDNDQVADMQEIRNILGRIQPPEEFCFSEIGDSGPIISTIHASKGREEENVRLMIPSETYSRKNESDYEEAARVYFVGATRAKKHLTIQKYNFDYFYHWGRTEMGRRYNKKGSRRLGGSIQLGQHYLEVGLKDDISAKSVAGSDYYLDTEEVRKNQKRLISLAGQIKEVYAIKKRPNGYAYQIHLRENGEGIGFFSDAFNKDLCEIGTNKRGDLYGLPNRLDRFLIFGIRTIVLPPYSPDYGKLFQPWAKSGFMVAPVVMGWAFGDFDRCEEGDDPNIIQI